MPLPWCGCNIWMGSVRYSRGNGGEGVPYGKINVRSRMRYKEKWHTRFGHRKVKSRAAHRLSLADALGLPYYKVKEAAHVPWCASTLCIEPAHLRNATRIQNERDKRAKL